MDLERFLNMYALTNIMGLVIFAVIHPLMFYVCDNIIEDMKQSIRVKHMFLLPIILLFLPLVLLFGVVPLTFETKLFKGLCSFISGIFSSFGKILNKELIVISKGDLNSLR